MDSAKIRERADVLRQIAEVSNAIRRKHRMIRSQKETAEQVMGEIFKPLVTPLQKLVHTSEQQQIKQETKTEPEDLLMKNEKTDEDLMEPDIKLKKVKYDYDEDENMNYTDDEDYEDEDDDDENHEVYEDKDDDGEVDDDEDEDDDTLVAGADIPLTSTPIKEREDPVPQYLQMFGTKKQKDLDTTYGVRKLTRSMMIGDSQINFDDNLIYVGDKRYEKTPGLLELLFKKSPNPTVVNDEDKENYVKIVTMTNAHRKHYKADRSLRENKNSKKYKNFIAQYVGSPQSQKKSGKGLPKYKIAPKKRRRIDNVYWDDPNELVDRLRLLIASQAAGNTGHSNEIVSIIEQLRDAGIIY